MSIENKSEYKDIDQTPEREKFETEKKYTLVDRHFFDFYKQTLPGKYIHQIYLSSPSEAFSLRIRQTETEDGVSYSAAQKSRGAVGETGLKRLETPTAISKESFDAFLERGGYASLRKLRVEPMSGMTIDWIEGWDEPLLEIEDLEINEEAQQFLHLYKDLLIDRSGQPEVDNEYIAHVLSGSNLEKESFNDLDPESIVDEILAYRRIGMQKVVVGISGRSGSGKTTLAKQVQTLLAYKEQLPSNLLSTDDYHVGKTYLERTYGAPWENWDLSVVYDTKRMADDIELLKVGEKIGKRSFSFETQEPVVDGLVTPHDIILVEGIHAGSHDLKNVRTAYFELETPLSTCIARDVSRLRDGSRPNSTIGSPEQRLRYQLEYAEPSYLKKDRPGRNAWSASIRPIGGLALKNKD